MMSAIELGAEPASVADGRRFCAEVLGGWGATSELVDRVSLLVSELITNVVLHAGTTCSVTVSRRGPVVRVEVTDHDPTIPTVKHYDIDAGSGRGLHLVDVLSERFGADSLAVGKTVWFEVRWTPEHTAAATATDR